MRASVSCRRVSGHAFLGLDELVQALLPGAVRHQPTGELVDDDHTPVGLDQVVRVAVIQVPRVQRLAHQVLAAEPAAPDTAQRLRQLVQPRAPAPGEVDPPLARIDGEVRGVPETRGQLQRLLVDSALGPGVEPRPR